MPIFTFVSPTRPLGSLSPEPEPRLLWGAVEEHETIRRRDFPHKEPLLSLHIHFTSDAICPREVLLPPLCLLIFLPDSLSFYSSFFSIICSISSVLLVSALVYYTVSAANLPVSPISIAIEALPFAH